MARTDSLERPAAFTVENVGGIDEADVEVGPGVTVLAGENATNRTSFLQAVQAALGSDDASLKGDADEGRVELALGEETYERRLVRENGAVAFHGEAYLEDATVADLFAFLLEDNDARRAVARAEDLREIIMRPVDVAAIQREIEALEAEKAEINQDLADIGNEKRRLTELEQRRTALREEVEDKRAALADKEAEIESASVDVEESKEQRERREQRLASLSETRNELEGVRRDVDSVEESIASLEEERAEVQRDLEALPEDPASTGDLESDIDRLRREKQSLETAVRELQSAIQFNEEMLEDAESAAVAELTDGADDPTAKLLEDEVVCWTCGSEATREDVEATLASLRELRQDKLDEVGDVEDRLEELRSERQEVERARERRTSLEERRGTIEDELERRQEALDSLKDDRADLATEIEELEAEIEDLEAEDVGGVLERHREANELEFEIQRREDELEDVAAEIEAIEEQLDREADLEARREEVLDELEECRTRIDRIEAEAVEAFNTHMDAVLDVLGYDNIERIWIERVEETVRQGRETVTTTVFELHVVRRTESGAVYEDTVDHLSESEREVTGLIFALAGYLVHDVHETAPFMLLDSLEAIDSGRIATLVEYFAEYASFLVVALLPEDARALSDDYDRVRDI